MALHGKKWKSWHVEGINRLRVRKVSAVDMTKVQSRPFSPRHLLAVLRLGKIIERMIGFREFLVRYFVPERIVLQPDARIAAPAATLLFQLRQEGQRFVIWYAFFQKLIVAEQWAQALVHSAQCRECMLVVVRVGGESGFEVGDDGGEGLEVGLHLLVVATALVGLARAHEGGHGAEDVPQPALLLRGQLAGVVVEEEHVPQLLLSAPVSALRENTRISVPPSVALFYPARLGVALGRFLLDFDLVGRGHHFSGINYIDIW